MFGAYANLTAVMMHILKRAEWSFMQKSGTLATVDAYNTGTVSVTNGSTSITGSGTTWTSSMTGRKIAIDNSTVEYTFTYVSATSGTLDRNYEGSTDSGLSHIIYQDVYALASDFNKMLVLRDATNNVVMGEWTIEQIEEFYSAAGAAGTPTRYALFGEDSSGYPQVRLYPAPGDVISYAYQYLKQPTVMGGEADLLDTPPKYDHVVIAHLAAMYTQKPEDHVIAAQLLENMVRDNIRHARSAIVKQMPSVSAGLPLGQNPTLVTGPS